MPGAVLPLKGLRTDLSVAELQSKLSEVKAELAAAKTEKEKAFKQSKTLKITLMGLNADMDEALSVGRFPSAISDSKAGIKKARVELAELEALLKG